MCVALLVLVACRSGDKPAQSASREADHATGSAPVAQAPADAAGDPGHCEQQPFAESTPLPEASGAAWLTIDGALSLVAVGDSGHNGAYAVIDPETGATREQGTLPLGTGNDSDDLEGLAAHGDELFGLTSNGWMRVWQRKGKGFALVDGPYPIGDLGGGMACADKCTINYEGLALAAAPQQGCTGFACSKGDGHVYCLEERDGKYRVDRARGIAVTRKGALADCAFDDRDQLWVGNNVFGMDQVYRVDGWGEPATAKVVSTNAFGVGFPEVIAARGDVIYRMSDTGGAPSLMAKFRCLAPKR
jgi:outer membrane protein assembly factor BamB